MKKVLLILGMFVLMMGLVSAEDGLDCSATGGPALDVTTEGNYLYLVDFPDSNTAGTYSDCSLHYGDDWNLALDVELVDGDGGFAGSFSRDIAVEVMGYDVSILSGTEMIFGKDSFTITLPEDSKLTLLDKGGLGIVLAAEGGEGTFSLGQSEVVYNTERISSENVDVAAPKLLVRDEDLVISSKFGVYFFEVNGYELSLSQVRDTVRYTTAGHSSGELLVTLNEQGVCEDKTLKDSWVWVYDVTNLDDGFRVNDEETGAVCNAQLYLPNANQVAQPAISYRLVAGMDGAKLALVFSEFEDATTLTSVYPFVLNAGETLEVFPPERDNGVHIGEITFPEYNADAKPVENKICGQAQFSYNSGTVSGNQWTDKTKLAFSFDAQNAGADYADGTCTMTKCLYYGDSSSSGAPTLWCGDEDSFPKWSLLNTKDVNGLQYENGVWECVKGDCLDFTYTKLYPVKVEEYASSDLYITFPQNSLTRSFQEFKVLDSTLVANAFYVGYDGRYKVKSEDGEASFVTGSLQVDLDAGGKVKVKDGRDFVFASETTGRGGAGYSLYFDDTVASASSGLNFASATCNDCSGERATASGQVSLVGCEEVRGNDLADEGTLVPVRVEPDDDFTCELSKITTTVTIGDVSALTFERDGMAVTDLSTSTKAVFQSRLQGDTDNGDMSCQCGSRAALDPDYSVVASSTYGGLWSSRECSSTPGCEFTGCSTGEDAYFYMCTDAVAQTRTDANRNSGSFDLDAFTDEGGSDRAAQGGSGESYSGSDSTSCDEASLWDYGCLDEDLSLIYWCTVSTIGSEEYVWLEYGSCDNKYCSEGNCVECLVDLDCDNGQACGPTNDCVDQDIEGEPGDYASLTFECAPSGSYACLSDSLIAECDRRTGEWGISDYACGQYWPCDVDQCYAGAGESNPENCCSLDVVEEILTDDEDTIAEGYVCVADQEIVCDPEDEQGRLKCNGYTDVWDAYLSCNVDEVCDDDNPIVCAAAEEFVASARGPASLAAVEPDTSSFWGFLLGI